MATPLAPSNIFPIDPSLAAISRLSESACSYVAHKMSQLSAQPYRGSVGSSRPSTAESAAVPDIQSEIQALTARVAMLQQQLAGPDAELQQLAGKVAALEKVPLRTHARSGAPRHTRAAHRRVSRAQATGAEQSLPAGVASTSTKTAYFDSCAKYAGEASRIRDAGRLWIP